MLSIYLAGCRSVCQVLQAVLITEALLLLVAFKSGARMIAMWHSCRIYSRLSLHVFQSSSTVEIIFVLVCSADIAVHISTSRPSRRCDVYLCITNWLLSLQFRVLCIIHYGSLSWVRLYYDFHLYFWTIWYHRIIKNNVVNDH